MIIKGKLKGHHLEGFTAAFMHVLIDFCRFYLLLKQLVLNCNIIKGGLSFFTECLLAVAKRQLSHVWHEIAKSFLAH